jgi:CheY-like chemotaxis protein
MPLEIDGQTYYRTVEVQKMLGVSRATLLRWLKQGILNEPEYRDGRGWRLFTVDNVARIRNEASKIIQPTGRVQGNPIDSVPRILVVDDEPAIGKAFQYALEEQHYRVTAVTDSREALELITEGHFDLIFLDLKMPELDGPQLLRHIRELDNHAQVAIITGYPDSELMDRAMEQGPFLVMKKPFGSDDILKAVRILLSSVATESPNLRRKSDGTQEWHRGI